VRELDERLGLSELISDLSQALHPAEKIIVPGIRRWVYSAGLLGAKMEILT
jgi:hypothetical protein